MKNLILFIKGKYKKQIINKLHSQIINRMRLEDEEMDAARRVSEYEEAQRLRYKLEGMEDIRFIINKHR